MKELKPGQILEVLSDDRGILTDMPAWCRVIGYEIVHADQEGGQYRFYVRKTKE